jgi:hypothetical protein
MLQSDIKKLIQAKRIRNQIEQGIVPVGFSVEKIFSALTLTRKPNVFEMFGFLSAVKKSVGRPDIDFGLVSARLVTTAFAAYLVDSLQDSTTYPMDVFKYHASGTGTTAEANTQTALVTEVETRATGSLAEGASSNIFKTVGTQTYTATRTIAEHGIFSQSAVGGTMLDRSLLGTTIPVVNTDQIEWTYELTVNAET